MARQFEQEHLLTSTEGLGPGSVVRFVQPRKYEPIPDGEELLVLGISDGDYGVLIGILPLLGAKKEGIRHALTLRSLGIACDATVSTTKPHAFLIGEGFPLEVEQVGTATEPGSDALYERVVATLVSHAALPENQRTTSLYEMYVNQQ